MLNKQPADDLFEQSSMSFGEHLEELRKSLTKAFIWLGIGTVAGLFFAKSIVRYIETPLKSAIYDFHVEQAKQRFLEANGFEPSEQLAAMISDKGVVPEVNYVDPKVLVFDELADAGGNLSASDTPSAKGKAESNRPSGGQIKSQRSGQVPSSGEPDDRGQAPTTVDESSSAPASANDPSDPDSIGQSGEAAGERPNAGDAAEGAAEPDEFDESKKANLAKPTVNVLAQQVSSAETTADAAAEEATERDAWKGVDEASLDRLRPFILWKPISNKMVTLNATEGFMIWLKAGLVAGCVIGSPGIFWHIWQFFAAGLYPHERRYVYWYLPLSLVLFLAGVSLAFFVVFKLVLGFLMKYTAELDVEFMPRLNDYMSFALFLPLGFGIAFQLPLVMLGLHRFGVVSVETFVSQWRVAVLAIAFLSMILTPAEIYSMIGLFIPLTGLYFFGIALCKWMPRGAGIGSPGEDPHD